MDTIFLSIMNLLLFGYVTVFLAGQNNQALAQSLLLGMILWEVVRLTQYTVTVSAMWNIWSRNLTNMFISPLTLKEYVGAHMLSGTIKTIAICWLIAVMSLYLFNFNIFSVGWTTLLLSFINLTLFAYALGFVLLGLIFRYGTKIQSLAWGLIYLFQPLSAAFFPISVLPIYLKPIAYALPASYVFEAARESFMSGRINWEYHGIAFGLNVVYLIVCIYIFKWLFERSKETGQFARNEG